jgi:hypothetical protein
MVLRFGRENRRFIKTGMIGVCIVAALNGTVGIVKLFPFSHIYFNSLAGGLEEAGRVFGKDEIADYWGFSYRKGIEWLNKNTPRESIIYVPVAGWTVKLVRNVWLRPDLSILTEKSEIETALRSPLHPIYMMFVERPTSYTDLMDRAEKEKTPVYKIEKANKTMLSVYCIYP